MNLFLRNSQQNDSFGTIYDNHQENNNNKNNLNNGDAKQNNFYSVRILEAKQNWMKGER